MKNLFLLFAALFFISCANTESKEQKAEAVVAENQMSPVEAIKAGRVENSEIVTDDMLKQMEAMDKAIEKAGGQEKFQAAMKQSNALMADCQANPSNENLKTVLDYLEANKIPIITTDGLLYDREKVSAILARSGKK